MAKKEEVSKPDNTKLTCGVIMPIAEFNSYTVEHWKRVQSIIYKAIEKSEMKPQVVWEKTENDVIHSKILHNIYDNDVIICDVSGLNPNVMLELGLRLSTKKPTIVITDAEEKPPFDISNYQYHKYPKNLEYNAIDKFIDEIAEKIQNLLSSHNDGEYKSFVEGFTFEVVEPSEVPISNEEAVRLQLSKLNDSIQRIERSQEIPRDRRFLRENMGIGKILIFDFFETTDDNERLMLSELMTIPPVINIHVDDTNGINKKLVVSLRGRLNDKVINRVKLDVETILESHGADVPF